MFSQPKSANLLRDIMTGRQHDSEVTSQERELLRLRVRSRVAMLAGRMQVAKAKTNREEHDNFCDQVFQYLLESAQGMFPTLEEFERVLKRMAAKHLSAD